MPSLGQQIRFGRVDEPPADPPAYRDWVPDERVDDTEDWCPSVVYTTPGRTGRDVAGRPFTLGRVLVQHVLDYVGVDLETMGFVAATSDVALAVGDVDRASVDETIPRTGYSEAGSYRELDLYSRADTDRTLAVGDDVLLASSGEHARALVERVYDTGRGHAPRAYETNDAFRTFVDHVGASPFVWLFGGVSGGPYEELPDSTFTTSEVRFDEDHVYFLNRSMYEDGATIDRRTVEQLVHETDRTNRAHNVDVRVDGRFAGWITQLTHSEYHEAASGPAGFVEPHVTWGVEDDGDELTFVHEAGDAVDAALLEVTFKRDSDRHPAARQFADEFDRVEPGDSLTVDATEFAPWDRVSITGSRPDSPNEWAELHYDRD